MRIEMLDEVLIDIITDDNYVSGCETCDYGSKYINKIEFHFESGKKIVCKTVKMYELLINQSDFIKFCVNYDFKKKTSENLTEDFKDFIMKQVEQDPDDVDVEINKETIVETWKK